MYVVIILLVFLFLCLVCIGMLVILFIFDGSRLVRCIGLIIFGGGFLGIVFSLMGL